ncbi:MAG: sodium-translocating pyrophosphatase [Chitinophagaceae bacterium]
MKKILLRGFLLLLPLFSMASEVNLQLPIFEDANFSFLNMNGRTLLCWSFIIIAVGLIVGLKHFRNIKKQQVHKSMLAVSETIYATCKTYLLQQGRFLVILFAIVGIIIAYYFGVLGGMTLPKVLMILVWTILGILGSYLVAWFGIRINTFANSRAAFSSLKSKPWNVVAIPLEAGISIGLLLVSVELLLILSILLFVSRESAGACLIGFAIGESLGASALRIAGGIFTKIADIGSDLMKVVFKIGEDDPRNPGVIADCTGDNAGDSVGPTADGFETYGVTNVALMSFIILAIFNSVVQSTLIVWILVMSVISIFTSLVSYYAVKMVASKRYAHAAAFNFENPLTALVWTTSILSIVVTYITTYFLLNDLFADTYMWLKLATIISLGIFAAAIIPELTKVFTSTNSRHVKEIVINSREGGASLNILSGLVAGNFSAFWKGLTIMILMATGFWISNMGFSDIMQYPSIFAFGLIAFGLVSMLPVSIAVDSYGPVADNAQSVFELSQIQAIPNISQEIEKEFQFKPHFERGKEYLEANDSAGNTFKATTKPVLIGTAVVGATTMIFSIILLLQKMGLLALQLTDAPVILGFITGGAVIYWFSGASMQAVTVGAYRAVEFIKKNLNLDKSEANIEDSKKVVKICTQYAQYGMWNIFAVIFTLTIAFAFLDSNFFVAYLVSIAVFGLFQAMYMANAGGAWDNAKKVVEVDLKEKNTPLHDASIVGDTVGDPYKDTSSVALNPIIKFSTLFGLLAVEIALEMNHHYGFLIKYIGVGFFIIGLYFVYRSFYKMRIK